MQTIWDPTGDTDNVKSKNQDKECVLDYQMTLLNLTELRRRRPRRMRRQSGVSCAQERSTSLIPDAPCFFVCELYTVSCTIHS